MSILKTIARYALGAALIFAGVGHLTFFRAEFQAQVPVWLPLAPDFVVLASGVVEILLGIGLLFFGRAAQWAGLAAAAFFVAIFPGNINQFAEGIDAFGLNSDEARFTRLFFQPLLVIWALWSSSAWSLIKELMSERNPRT